MIALLTRWDLKDGFPAELKASLLQLADDVRTQEPGTLLFAINTPAADPPPIGPPPEYEVRADLFTPSDTAPEELVLFEIYRDAKAFRDHLVGPFQTWLIDNRDFLKTPASGRPRPSITFLDPHSPMVRASLALEPV